MVFVKDFRKEFYDVIQHQRLLVLVNYDVDALCACKILQYLFQCDHVPYTIVPISGRQDLLRAFVENSEGVQYVLLINAGASIDVVEFLQPEDHVVFYICDSHRPVDVHNMYNQVQVKLLMKQDEIEDAPLFDEIFRDEESSDEDSGNESDSTEPRGKRRRFDEEALEKRRERRLWEERRQQILFRYSEFASYGTSSAFLMFEMAWKMSKDTNDLLWLAIVGVTDQFIQYKVDRDKYIEDVGDLQAHVSRHNHRPDDEENVISIDCLKVTFDTELQLTLYRHWSLFESLCHSANTACKFRVWTMKGKKKLQEFLADMGIPLTQCRQKYASMDVNLKESVKEMIASQVEKYNLNEQEMFLPSFHAQYGFRHKYCAVDLLHSCNAVLESVTSCNDGKDLNSSDHFLSALDLLNRSKTDMLEKGLEMAKLQLKAIVTQVQSFLDMNQVISAGPFLYAFVQEGSPDGKFFSHPICLLRLARFTLDAYCSISRSKKAPTLPLVLGAPLDTDGGTMLVVGIPPKTDRSYKNCFGKAFEQAAQSTNSRTQQDSFDSNLIELKTEDKSKFFDALISLLQ